MPPRSLLTLRDIHLRFGREALLDGAEIDVAEGDRLCLVGRNGSGKSSLMKVAAGLQAPDRGERFLHPDATLRYLAQEVDFAGNDTVSAFVAAGLGPTDDPYRGERLLADLGLDGAANPARLSGGEARRAALARTLAPDPDILLLDEPTNHLDIAAIEWLERELAGRRAALVLVSHDRRFLEALSRATVWIDRGKVRRLEQGFSAFEGWRDAVLEQEERERHLLDRKIVRENEWMHGGVTARRKRNMRRVRELDAMRKERREARKATGTVRLEAAGAGLSSRLIAEATGVTKVYGETAVVRDLTLRVLRGDRLGIVGPNGAGKTTIVRLLTGTLAPDAGTVRLGESLEVVTLDQGRDELAPEWTLTEALTGGRGDRVTVNGQTRHVVGYMKDFLFSAEQARSPVRVLSGGERGRLMLARALARPSNVLVLDEPTNDLDMETLDLLQEMLADYPGTVVVVSHDRDFLDRVATSVLVAEGEGRWLEYAGGYTDMLAQRRAAGRGGPITAEGKPGKGSGGRPAGSAGSTAPPAMADGPASPGATPPSLTRARKLTFKEKHALETLPARMTVLEAEVATLRTRMADPGLFARDGALFTRTAGDLEKAETALAAAEEEWLRLEMLREEIEAGGG
jgi:ATP-binding cassette subfamily F protein uup